MILNIHFPDLGQPVGVLIHHVRRATATASSFARRVTPAPGMRPNRAAVFFFCPHHSANHRHAVNCRGLRLVWLLCASKQLRRVA